MLSAEQTIHTFYQAFRRGDYATMQSCYADTASFTDEVFIGLNAAEVRAMWEMLCKSGKDMRIEYRNVTVTETGGSAEWTAWYTFSATGRKVGNRVRSSFTLQDGRIIAQRDYFSFAKWARQALGWPGLLLGHTGFLRRRIQERAQNNLRHFMQKNA